MIRRNITLSELAARAAETLPKGVLLTSRVGDKINSMVIGWGTVGVNWGKPVFAAYVRVGRFTRELLDQNPEFTVNLPLGSRSDCDCSLWWEERQRDGKAGSMRLASRTGRGGQRSGNSGVSCDR